MNDKNKRIFKYVIIAILIMFPIWLFGFKISFLKVDDNNPDRYETMYRGKRYINCPVWSLHDDRFGGFANGLSSWVYKSTGDDRNKFIEVWEAFNVETMGYGAFYREDIELKSPSSSNIGEIYLQGFEEEVSEEIKYGILNALDEYNKDETIGVPEENINSNENYAYVYCHHSQYNLSCTMNVTSNENNYYIIVLPSSIYIPLDNDIGEQIVKLGGALIEKEEISADQYSISYRGQEYFLDKDFLWEFEEPKQIGISMDKEAVYKPAGDAENMVLCLISDYGDLFGDISYYVSEDIIVSAPSMESVDEIEICIIRHLKKGDLNYTDQTLVKTQKREIVDRIFSYINNESVTDIGDKEITAYFNCINSEMPSLICRIRLWRSLDSNKYYIKAFDDSGYFEVDNEFVETMHAIAD